PFANAPDMSINLYAGRKDKYRLSMYNLMGVYSEALPYFGYKVTEGEMITQSATPKKTVNLMFGSETAYDFEDTKRSWRTNLINVMPYENVNQPDPFVNPINDKITMKLESQQYD